MPEILTAEQVAAIRLDAEESRVSGDELSPIEMVELCDSHEALRAKLAEAEKESDELRLALIGTKRGRATIDAAMEGK